VRPSPLPALYRKVTDVSLFRNYRLPIIYVFGKRPIDVDDAAHELLESYTISGISAKTVVLRHDVAYTHAAGASGGATAHAICRPLVESLVSALQDLFANRNTSVSYNAIPRRLSPSSASTAPAPVTENGNHIVDPDPRLDTSGDITPILYVGSASLGLTNLLMTNPATPVRTGLRSPEANHSVRSVFPAYLRSMDTTP
jgi:diphthamide biosynthesis protein 2